MDEDDVSSGRVVVGGIGGAAAAVVEAMIGEAPIPDCYGRRWDWEERVEGSGGGATVPACYSAAGTVYVGERQRTSG
jgi:hypothetical protein